MVLKIFMSLLSLVFVSYAGSDVISKAMLDLKKQETVLLSDFAKIPGDAANLSWIKAKIKVMVDVDQLYRKAYQIPHENKFSKNDQERFMKVLGAKVDQLDQQNTAALKELLTKHEWFKISVFGEITENNAWLLVQHADLDVPFQKSILTILERLYPLKETNPRNYAYLFDRVANSSRDLSLRKPQRFGTQGACTGPGTWEPSPVEEPKEKLDERRASVGLEPIAEYKKRFKNICHEDQRPKHD